MTRKKGRSKGEMRGSLHCPTDGETVRCFGRDDEFLVGGRTSNCKGRSKGRSNCNYSYNCKKQVPFGDNKQEKQLQLQLQLQLQGFFAALRMTNVKVDE